MLISRNCSRQGKASRKNEAVDTYGDAFTQYHTINTISIASTMVMQYKTIMLVSRNCSRQGKASAKPDGVVTYGKGDKTTEFCSILKFIHPKKEITPDLTHTTFHLVVGQGLFCSVLVSNIFWLSSPFLDYRFTFCFLQPAYPLTF